MYGFIGALITAALVISLISAYGFRAPAIGSKVTSVEKIMEISIKTQLDTLAMHTEALGIDLMSEPVLESYFQGETTPSDVDNVLSEYVSNDSTIKVLSLSSLTKTAPY